MCWPTPYFYDTLFQAYRRNKVEKEIGKVIDNIQKELFERAVAFRNDNTERLDSYDRLREYYSGKGGFGEAYWCGSEECETEIQKETKATIRVIPLEQPGEKGSCVKCGKESKTFVVFAKAY
ncbi:MAG: hypothetical protein IH825_03795 [Candidatus Marinimicrobia bacterium]|nr:hypothetical protein [Candidatus Neomarinimicrobiota bacterium]